MKLPNPSLPTPDIQVATQRTHYKNIIELRTGVYSKVYPDILSVQADQFDFGTGTQLFYTMDSEGKVASTSRLVEDDTGGLPSEKFFTDAIRSNTNSGVTYGEFGKLICIGDKSGKLVKAHHLAIYKSSLVRGIDVVLMVSPYKRKSLYTKKLGAELLVPNIGESFGSGLQFSVFAWIISETKDLFFNWVNS